MTSQRSNFFSVQIIKEGKNKKQITQSIQYSINQFNGQPAQFLIDQIKKEHKIKKSFVLLHKNEQIPKKSILDLSSGGKDMTFRISHNFFKLEAHYDFENTKLSEELFEVYRSLSIKSLKKLIAKMKYLSPLNIIISDSMNQSIPEDVIIQNLMKSADQKSLSLNIQFTNSTFYIKCTIDQKSKNFWKKLFPKSQVYEIALPGPYEVQDVQAILAARYGIPYDAIRIEGQKHSYTIEVDAQKQSNCNISKQKVAFKNALLGQAELEINVNITFYEVAVHLTQYVQSASTQLCFKDNEGNPIDKNDRVRAHIYSTPIEFFGSYTLYVLSQIDHKIHPVPVKQSTIVWYAQKTLLSPKHLPSHYRFFEGNKACNLNNLAHNLPLGSETKPRVTFKQLDQPDYVIPVKVLNGQNKRLSCRNINGTLGEFIYQHYPAIYNYITPKAEGNPAGKELDIFEPMNKLTQEIYNNFVTQTSNTGAAHNSGITALNLACNKNEAWFLFKYQNQKLMKVSFTNPTKITVGTIIKQIKAYFNNQNTKAIQLRYHDNILDENDSFAFKSEKWNDAIIIEDKVDSPVKRITIGSKEYPIEMKKEETLSDLKQTFINKYSLNCSQNDITFYSSPDKPLKDTDNNPPERIYAAFRGNGRLCTIILHNPVFEKPFIIVGNTNDKNNIAGQISSANGITVQANDITPTNDGFRVTFPNPAKNITFEFPSGRVTVNDANRMMIQDALKQKNIFFSPACIKQVVFKLWNLPIPLDTPCLDGVPPQCPVKVEFQQNNVPIFYSDYTFYFKELETIPAVQQFIQETLQVSHVEIQLNQKKLNSNEQLKINNGYQLSIRLSVKITEKGSTQTEHYDKQFDYVSTILDLKKLLSQFRSNSFISLSSGDIIIYEDGVQIADENARLITFKNLSYEVIKKQLSLQLHFEKSLCNSTSRELQFDFSKTIGDLLQTVRNQFGIIQEIVAGSASSLTPQTIYDNQTTLQAAVESKGNVIYIFKKQTNNPTHIEAIEDDNANYVDTIEEEEEENDSDPVPITEDPLDQDSFMLTQTIDYTKTRFERIKVTSTKYKFRSNLSERPYKVRIYKDETVEMMKDKIAAAFDYDQSKLSVYDSITNTLLDDKMVLNPEIVNNMELFVYVHSQSTRPSGDNPGDEDIEEYEYEYD